MAPLTQAVRVWHRARTGADPMGEPVYAWRATDVEGVLVRPLESPEMEAGDEASDVRPDAVRARLSLAFPKTYDGPPLRHARVTLLHPAYGMSQDPADGWRDALAVIGDPAPTVPCPTPWNMTVLVGRSHG